MKRAEIMAAALAVALSAGGPAAAQRSGVTAETPRSSAPVDLTGYWVAVVSEDWRHRMATPRKGDFESLPLNAEGRRVANEWDLAADNAAGLQCKAFGVGGLVRQPGRLHVTWADDDTLKIDFDAGTQTRLLEFAPAVAPGGEPTWQGFSRAEWQRPPGGNQGPVRAQIGNSAGPIAPGGGGRGQRGGPPPTASLTEGGALKVVTTDFRAGYLRKNGVPYSEDAAITEYFHRLPEHASGDIWLHVLTIVEDPRYLNGQFLTSTHFKREPNGSKFNPTECRTAPPPPPPG
ncbi:MAG: hypothetical protein EHM50_00375 [Lysobacterales bacterium]|nr:MAG: hypothetical protein EHM50_00375 [Xanthomonadales bacterium]